MEIDRLAIGLTRPALYKGIDIRLFFINLLFWTIICLNLRTFLGIPFGVLSYLIIKILSGKEPKFYSLLIVYYRVSMPLKTTNLWGRLNSYAPW